MGALLLTAGPALAHRLKADSKVDVTHKRVTIESYYETGDVPHKANVKVTRPDGSLLVEGPLDEQGKFTFEYEEAETLEVIVTAPGGHRKELTIAAAKLRAAPQDGSEASPSAPTPADGRDESRVKDVLIGVGFVLAAAAFALSLRNARELRRLRRAEGGAFTAGREGR
jgi:hypothetical protein